MKVKLKQLPSGEIMSEFRIVSRNLAPILESIVILQYRSRVNVYKVILSG